MTDRQTSGSPDGKRRKLSLQVSIEANADGRVPVHQVFADGTFIPATTSHFDRTSAAASAFVARALAPPVPTASSTETRATHSEVSAQWASTVVTEVEGAIYELGKAIAVIEALRATPPLLELKRTTPARPSRATPADINVSAAGLPSSIARHGAAVLMSKRRAMGKSADMLFQRAKSLSKWIEADNLFCDAFVMLRKRCNGIRRGRNGQPLIDVGDGHFVPVQRHVQIQTGMESDLDAPPLPPQPPQPQTQQPQTQQPQPQTQTQPAQQVAASACGVGNEAKKPCLRIQFPATTFLKFGVNCVEENFQTTMAPVFAESGCMAEDQSLKAMIRRIRLSRVSAFRRKTFELVAEEVASLKQVAELTTNAVGIECGPYDIVRIEKTQRSGLVSSLMCLDAGVDGTSINLPENISDIQNACLLQIIAAHACFTQTFMREKQGQLLDKILSATTSRSVMQSTESILDDLVHCLRVRLEWTRGSQRAEEARVRIFSTEADGDGPERALATIEPISKINNGGEDRNNGHVRIIPAFGVIIPSPDDASARGRAIPPHSSSSSGASAFGLDDVPRSYICPVGGEIGSILTLLLCIRLLDAFETAARAGVEEMLDVDRQCFTVIVSCPKTGRTLKAKVWPRGPGMGREVPGATAWLDGKKVERFATRGVGRVVAWGGLLKRLVETREGGEREGGEREIMEKREGEVVVMEKNVGSGAGVCDTNDGGNVTATVADGEGVLGNGGGNVANGGNAVVGARTRSGTNADEFEFEQNAEETSAQYRFDL